MSLDSIGGQASPLDPARRLVGEIYAPVDSGVESVLGPFLAVPRWFESQDALRADVDRLQAENTSLRGELAGIDFDRNRLVEYDGLTATAEQIGYALVPARVIGVGPAQAFSRTVTIDAGSQAGLRPDLTVVSAAGLVGRVIRVTTGTATVLLLIDADSTVGGRLASSMKIGFLRGRGELADFGPDPELDLELVDQSSVPRRGETVVTWGSQGGAPYVAGVPIGTVDSVFSDLRDSTQHAVITPYVDFGALDLVGVVVPSGTTSDRAVIEPDGTMR
ncbi:rod shape-determining protein MreC [Nocardioides sp.]|uniref:rod shape-determining protein MreC n=1 Tax=Nocardioides sp. TaxID=35761 RepID=UPI003565C2F2